MPSLQGIAYLSTARHPFSRDELEQLLAQSHEFNRKVGVTGALLCHDQTFLQYFEGPPDGVRQVYNRILASPAHHGIIELMNEPISERAFPEWLMGFVDVPQGELLRLQQARWRHMIGSQQDDAAAPTGLSLLLQFWRNAHPGAH